MKTVTGRIKESRYIMKLFRHGVRYSVFKPPLAIKIDLAEAERRTAAFLRDKEGR